MITDKGYSVIHRNFYYDSRLNENLSGKSILDYGCNNGNLLRSIPEDLDYTYTAVDVQQSFITDLSAKYSDHTFVHMDKYHPSYNPTGSNSVTLQDTVSATYDIIFAHNVFTHCSYEYTKTCLAEMRPLLNENGKIIFNLYSKENLIHISDIIENGRRPSPDDYHTHFTSLDSFNNYAYWTNGNTFTYDTPLASGDLNSLFSCYDITWVNGDNSDWTLRDTYANRNHTFTTS
jgi:SAM-dependent methyltransferase